MALTAKAMTSANGYRMGSTSTTNQNQGGGNAKAGLIPTKNVPHWRWIHMATAQTRNTLPNMGTPVIFGLKHTVNPCVQQSRPVGSRPQFNSYFLTGNQCCRYSCTNYSLPLSYL